MFKIKQTPEDFVVKEISNVEISDSGRYCYFKLWKKKYTTIRAIQRIADFLKIKMKDIGFAGNKDRNAITEQLISIKTNNEKVLEHFQDKELKLKFVGKGDEPISLGDLEANSFEILVESDSEPNKIDFIVNYFDEQRFSTNNVEIGRSIIKGEFKKAGSLIDNHEMVEYLQDHETDFVGGIQQIPLKTRQIFVHAFQSYLWNSLVSQYLQCKYKDFVEVQYSLGELIFPKKAEFEEIEIPIIGFGTEYEDPEIEKIAKELLKKEKINERNFVIPAIPAISAEGGMRNLFTEVKNLSFEKKEDNKYLVKFSLGKGSYATMVVKRMFN